MLSEILKIIPRLDQKDLNKMTQTLNGRFMKLSKSFGSGLKKSLLGGGIAGLAVGLIDKILNPLKEVQDAIDKALSKGDNLVTYAQQFNTTAGNLARLQSFAGAKGLDEQGLLMLLQKFQVAVAEAAADPTKQTSVRQYANRTDTADAFFEFIQNLQKLDRNQQTLVQSEVFGERQILKASEFLGADFAKLDKQLSKISTDKLTKAAEKLEQLEEKAGILEQNRGLEDLVNKSRVINAGMINQRDSLERVNLERENSRIKSYQDIAALNETAQTIAKNFDTFVQETGSFIRIVTPKINAIANAVDKFVTKPIARGILKMFGGE